MIIKQFEAFNSKDISSINRFLKNMNGDDAYEFISDITSIAEELDKPVSIFKGKYMSSKSASKIEGKDKSVQENYLKFWFSLKDGYLGKTISRKDNPSPYSSSIMNENGMLDTSQMLFIRERFYNKGVLTPITDYKSIKTGDEVIFIPSAGANPISSIVYMEDDGEVIQVYLLQNSFKDTVRMQNTDNVLKKYNKLYSYRIYRRYIDEYNKEFKIGHLSILKYTKTTDEIHQNLSSIKNDILDKVFFLNNNKVCNNHLRTYNWNKDLYTKLSNADYTLVIDLESIDNIKLSDIKARRLDNKPQPRVDDEYYKRVNKKRWVDKLGRSIKSKLADDQIKYYKNKSNSRYGSSYYDNHMVDMLLDLYRNGQIDNTQMDELLSRYY